MNVLRNLQFAVSVVAVGWITGVPTADASDLSDFLNQVFDEHADRRPTGVELNSHANMIRSRGALESYIALYSSDDYFNRQAQGDPSLYVVRLYQGFLERAPSPDEQRFWVGQFPRRSSEREAFVRRFCQANGVTEIPGLRPGRPNRPNYPSIGTGAQFADDLVSRINLFISMADNELGGSRYGRRVLSEARKLLSAAEGYQQAFRSGASPTKWRTLTEALENALYGLERQFTQIPNTSTQCQTVLYQISQMVNEITQSGAGAGAARPPAGARPPVGRPPVAAPAPAYSEIMALADSVRGFALALQTYQHQNPFYSSLARDVQELSTLIDSLWLAARQGQSASNLRAFQSSVQTRADRIDRDVRRADFRTQTGWRNVQDNIRSVSRALGMSSAGNVSSSRPVYITRPAWDRFPFQPSSPAYTQPCRDAVGLADQLTAILDDLLEALARDGRGRPAVNQLIDSTRNLKHSVLQFRQIASGGQFRMTLSQAADAVASQYQQMFIDVRRLVAIDRKFDSQLYPQISDLVQQIQRSSRGR